MTLFTQHLSLGRVCGFLAWHNIQASHDMLTQYKLCPDGQTERIEVEKNTGHCMDFWHNAHPSVTLGDTTCFEAVFQQ